MSLSRGRKASCATLVADSRAALDAGDSTAAARMLHSLRGNAGLIGAMRIAEQAGALEIAITMGKRDLDIPLQALEDALDALITAMAPWCDSDTPPPTVDPILTPIKPERPPNRGDTDLLTELRLALEQNDLEALDDVEQLRPRLITELGEERARALDEMIQALRFSEALGLLDQSQPKEP